MIEKLPLENILFLDIETVPETENFNQLDEELQHLWEIKTQYQRKNDFTPEDFYERAGIWAEFGKIVCLSIGYFTIKGDIRNFRVTSFFGEEKKILSDFNNLLANHFTGAQHLFCGHNIKEFDIPFIARRMVINQVPLPEKLNLFGKKTLGNQPPRYDGIVAVWRLQAFYFIEIIDQDFRHPHLKG